MNRIRELREAKKMTQLRLSVELEVSQETVSAYESGKHFPSYTALVKLSDIFGVGIDYLMGRTDVPLFYKTEITKEEQFLLSAYRQLNVCCRAKVEGYIQGLLEHK